MGGGYPPPNPNSPMISYSGTPLGTQVFAQNGIAYNASGIPVNIANSIPMSILANGGTYQDVIKALEKQQTTHSPTNTNLPKSPTKSPKPPLPLP
jgi:hypothetical protein